VYLITAPAYVNKL